MLHIWHLLEYKFPFKKKTTKTRKMARAKYMRKWQKNKRKMRKTEKNENQMSVYCA